MNLAVKVATFRNTKNAQITQSDKKKRFPTPPTCTSVRVQLLDVTPPNLMLVGNCQCTRMCAGQGRSATVWGIVASDLSISSLCIGKTYDMGSCLTTLAKNFKTSTLVVSAWALRPHRNSWLGGSLSGTGLYSRYPSCTKCSVMSLLGSPHMKWSLPA